MQQILPGVRRIIAPNPSPMTGDGTCSYVVGQGAVAVIDPGPADGGHLRALLDGLDAGERVAAILVTHAHLDHSPGARLLAEATGARIHAFGDALAGRSAVMTRLAATGLAGGGEGVDRDFRPDVILADGEELAMGDWRLRALHTPGHFGNHLCFAYGAAMFSGDLVMGWTSTLISPPDGDVGDYFRSLARLEQEAARVMLPGHGAPILAPQERIAVLAAHRHARTAQILHALEDGPATVSELVARLYTEAAPAVLPAAARNVFAHLVDLTENGQVASVPALTPEARFSRR